MEIRSVNPSDGAEPLYRKRKPGNQEESSGGGGGDSFAQLMEQFTESFLPDDIQEDIRRIAKFESISEPILNGIINSFYQFSVRDVHAQIGNQNFEESEIGRAHV